ncbi:MAG: aldehyde dehydrogenase family protein [Desulfocucumaceae bacterium]
MSQMYGNFIDGQWFEGSSGILDDYNPATGEVYARIMQASREDTVIALESAKKAQGEWASLPAHERSRVLARAAAVLQENMMDYVNVLIEESGSTFGKAMFESGFVIELLQSAAKDTQAVTGETFPSLTDKICFTIRQPKGVIAAISPWNFPFLLSMNKVAHALAAGNAVVLKPSSETPVIGLKIGDLFSQAGLPPGLLNVVVGPGSTVGEELIVSPVTRLITLTGSTDTGRIVAARAGQHLKPVVLELGGKDPVIVLADADLEYAVNAVAFGAFLHQGQICMSVERVIVEQSIAEEFAERLAAKARQLQVGDPKDHHTVIGPAINAGQLVLIDEHVRDAEAMGATILCGGQIRGRCYEPTVLTGVTREMRIFKEETFGPTAPIIAAANVEEAIDIANDSEYGLSSGVITNDLQKAVYIADRLESGMVHINDASVYDEPYAPFGGVKNSGIGREGGRASMEALTELKWITIQKGQRHFPF